MCAVFLEMGYNAAVVSKFVTLLGCGIAYLLEVVEG
jgi:hypothetical protein